MLLLDVAAWPFGAMLADEEWAAGGTEAVVPIERSGPDDRGFARGFEPEEGGDVCGRLHRESIRVGPWNRGRLAVRKASRCWWDVGMSTLPVLQYRIAMPMAEAEPILRLALQNEGFGILTEVDVQATLRAKLGVETPPHRLLGACNPKIAHAAIQAEPAVGAFLPCGIAIRQGATPDETLVSLQNPALMGSLFEVPGLAAAAREAELKLTAALESVGAPL